ncbi:alpha/beta hydrolase [Nocardia sp. NPDC101769]|uniref:alpha/beta hydrolase n=1 Tax=Nocardia sp. NPDC101769 TaxID=3364333 RepID=UPI0037FCFEAD
MRPYLARHDGGTVSTILDEVVLVAHSAGFLTLVHWAQQPSRPIRAAMLVTPPNFENPPAENPRIRQLAWSARRAMRRPPHPTRERLVRRDATPWRSGGVESVSKWWPIGHRVANHFEIWPRILRPYTGG